MAFWQQALILLVVVWALQALGTWLQMRHYRDVMREMSTRWPDGYMGAANAKGRLGKGVIALMLVTPDLIVRKLFLMEGRSVFAKFREFSEFEGRTLEELAAKPPFPDTEKARNEAMEKAIAQIRKARDGQLAAAPS